jgi:hypothetical protein
MKDKREGAGVRAAADGYDAHIWSCGKRRACRLKLIAEDNERGAEEGTGVTEKQETG